MSEWFEEMSPALSFSGRTSRGELWVLVLLELKETTVRSPRVNPFQQGQTLQLYWKQRQPKHKKVIHKLGDADLLHVWSMTYKRFAYDSDFAKNDGFRDAGELRDWFGDPDFYGGKEYEVIHWKMQPEAIVTNCHAVLRYIKGMNDHFRKKEYLEVYGRVLETNLKLWREGLRL